MILTISRTLVGHAPPVLAQAPPMPTWVDETLSTVSSTLGTSLITLVQAIAILAVGWIIASLARRITYSLLHRTDIDNKIAAWMTGGDTSFPIEKWIAGAIYWLIILFVVIAALTVLNLEQVSRPLEALLEEVTRFLPKVGGAAILLGVAWLLATLTKLIVVKGLRATRLDEKLGEQMGGTPEGGESLHLTETLANALYWFIFLLFLPSILSTLQLEGTLVPVQQLVNQVLGVLPNILAAVLIGGIGWLVAQIVRRVVTNLLAASGLDRMGEGFGFSSTTGQRSLSWILGTLAYVLVLIPVSIAALNALQIEAISQPAIAMLEQILAVLPNIFMAAIVLILGYVAGKYLSDLVTSLLVGLGFNHLYEWLGFASLTTQPQDTNPEEQTTPPNETVPVRTPSEIVGMIVFVAVLLIAALTAVDILQINALTGLVSGIMTIAGQVLAGAVVFAIGLYFANLAYNLIASSGNRQACLVGNAARISIITLVSAMALQQMGIAPNIVNLAFGLIVGAIAVAFAIAFGWGGRDIAAEQLRQWLESFKRD
nr:mechanosensitive ion channel [Spirulina subsalsa]